MLKRNPKKHSPGKNKILLGITEVMQEGMIINYRYKYVGKYMTIDFIKQQKKSYNFKMHLSLNTCHQFIKIIEEVN